jgi:tRNA dimethylallyltransferase
LSTKALNQDSAARIVCLAGPTGAGKSELALRIADRHHGAIVNFDSRQIYRGIPIVTAQPSEEEQSRCPHLLYGFLDPDKPMDAGTFAFLAARAIADVRREGYLPILVGGTGLYLRALLQGLAPVPPVDERVRARVAQDWVREGEGAMYERLKAVDPEYAAKVHPRDRQRVTRALEVFEQTGKPFTAWHAERVRFGSYEPFTMAVDITLDALTPRLRERIERMIVAGAVEEVRSAYARYPDPDAPAWSGIGCREILAHLRGEMTLEEAKEQWLRSTRAYAKRQLTWFRNDPGVRWFRPEAADAMALEVEVRLRAGA